VNLLTQIQAGSFFAEAMEGKLAASNSAEADLRFDFDDAAVFPDDEGEAEFAVFGAEGFVDAAEGAFEGFDHRRFAGFLGGQDTWWQSFGHGGKIFWTG